MLERCDEMTAAQAMSEMDSGLPKLWLIRNVLALRKRRPDLFGADAAYHPHLARGARLHHVVSYVRAHALMVVVPRFSLTLGSEWEDTMMPLPDGSWRSVLTGAAYEAAEVSPRDLFADFPVALLLREAAQ